MERRSGGSGSGEDAELSLLVLDPSHDSVLLQRALGQDAPAAAWGRLFRHDMNSISKRPQYQLLYVDPSRGVVPEARRDKAQGGMRAAESFDR